MPNFLPVLEEIEILIMEPIPQIEKIEERSFGYVVRNNEVTGLSLYEKGFAELPKSIVNLKFLKVLNLTSCYELKCLPDLLELDHLKSLVLDNCHELDSIPESLPLSLKFLVLSNCFSLTELPEIIDHLPNLTYLDLSYCENLKQIPTNLILKYVRGLITIKTVGCLAFKEEKINVTCHYCDGEILEDRFLEYEGKYYCEECASETFSSCRSCGGYYPNNDITNVGPGNICRDCFNEMYPDEKFDDDIDDDSEEHPPISQKDVEINEFLRVKFEDEVPHIYVNGVDFDYNLGFQGGFDVEVDQRWLFRTIRSSLQEWYKHDYDIRFFKSNPPTAISLKSDPQTAISLLIKLSEAGDPIAKRVFKEEILRSIKRGEIFGPAYSHIIGPDFEEIKRYEDNILAEKPYEDEKLTEIYEEVNDIEYYSKYYHTMEGFKINEFLTLKLEEGKTNIYVRGERFDQCRYLMFNIPLKDSEKFDEIDSIDEAADILGWTENGQEGVNYEIDPETEFWGHCSNLQAWYEHYYDTRLLHSNLAFPLLKELTNVGDPLAKKAFKEEIFKRLESGFSPVVSYLMEEGYLSYFNSEELSIFMREKFTELLTAVESIPESQGKRKAFRVLLRTIKGTYVMREKFGDLLTAVETMADDEDKRHAFHDLIFAIKGTVVMDAFSSRIETSFSNLLAAVETMQWGKWEVFRDLLRTIKGTYVMREKFGDLLTTVESMQESQVKRNAFSALLSEIKGTDVMREKFADLINAVETMADDEVKRHGFFTLLRAIEGTHTVREKFGDLLTLLETMPDDWTKPKAFSTLLYAIKRANVMDTFSSRIKTIFSHVLNAMKTLPDNWGKRDGFHDLLGAIEGTNLRDIFSSQIESTFSNLLAAVETMPDNRHKCDAFGDLLRAIEGTDLRDIFSSQIETTFSNLLAVVEAMPDHRHKCGVFRDLLRAIEGTDLRDIFSSQMETTFSNLLAAVETMPDNEVKRHGFFTLLRTIEGTHVMRENFADLLTMVETMPDGKHKCDAFRDLLWVIEGTDLMDAFSSRIEALKKIC